MELIVRNYLKKYEKIKVNKDQPLKLSIPFDVLY